MIHRLPQYIQRSGLSRGESSTPAGYQQENCPTTPSRGRRSERVPVEPVHVVLRRVGTDTSPRSDFGTTFPDQPWRARRLDSGMLPYRTHKGVAWAGESVTTDAVAPPW